MDSVITVEPAELKPLRGSYAKTLETLNRGSVEKHYDAYGDIQWSAPENRIDVNDPIWEMPPEDEGLARTSWYQSLPAQKRREVGLDVVCSFMRIGAQFESVLVRGLLTFAAAFPDAAPERRYAMHEAIEECQHIQMFREFIARSGLEVAGMSGSMRSLGRVVIGFARTRPALFWVFVMGGEDPIDFVQRRSLRQERPLHPLLRQIMQIHITEEARHLCFARMFIGEEVRKWPAARRHSFGLAAAPILNIMSGLMLYPTRAFIQRHQVPQSALREAFLSERARESKKEVMSKVREHFREVGLFTRDVELMWRGQGLA